MTGLWVAVIPPGTSANARSLGPWSDQADERVAYEPKLAASVAKPRPFAVSPTGAMATNPRDVAVLPVTPAAVRDLMLRDYDPDAPLPHPDLAGLAPREQRWDGPRPYVRREENGIVFGGLRVPFPRGDR